ncbi:MAG TPA: xanthine dehydrogenase accessory protein XdhC [Devosia sp.]|nr:xanthine dehydrogenase accessory protein XdhC [Devosia sp.]
MREDLLKLRECFTHPLVLVECTKAAGSTPREQGAWMLVGVGELLGTIGGGQLEFIAIDNARQMLRKGEAQRDIDVPLGPEIGQCCGGKVSLCLRFVTGEITDEIKRRVEREQSQFPHIFIMGAGHVGRALARALTLLPLKTIIVDTRADALLDLPESTEIRHSALPESIVRQAPAQSAFVVLTHDHALDFMITREALLRRDASYVGMIGSKTKRAAFISWMNKQGRMNKQVENDEKQACLGDLHCPIGVEKVADKRPEVIAALVAAEILVHTHGTSTQLTRTQTSQQSENVRIREGKHQ